jgi:hypothetical protein
MTTSPAAPAAYRTRTDVLFASRAPVAVVLRRGPRTHWQLLHWNTRTDAFTPGQWMKGLVKLCDLSPDGTKLIYWAAQYHSSALWLRRQGHQPGLGAFDPMTATKHVLRRLQDRHPKRKLPRYLTGIAPGRAPPRDNQGVWTAVSTPPYFSALAIWPAFGHWTGGGFFAGSREIILYEPECGLTPIQNTPLPSTLTISPWSRASEIDIRPTIARNPSRDPSPRHEDIAIALHLAGARFVDWSEMTPAGDLLFAYDGCIWRHSAWNGALDPAILTSATKLVDLTSSRFELVRAPDSAMRW